MKGMEEKTITKVESVHPDFIPVAKDEFQFTAYHKSLGLYYSEFLVTDPSLVYNGEREENGEIQNGGEKKIDSLFKSSTWKEEISNYKKISDLCDILKNEPVEGNIKEEDYFDNVNLLDSIEKEECKSVSNYEDPCQNNTGRENSLNVLPKEPILIEDNEDSSDASSPSTGSSYSTTDSNDSTNVPSPNKGSCNFSSDEPILIEDEEDSLEGIVSSKRTHSHTIDSIKTDFLPLRKGGTIQNDTQLGNVKKEECLNNACTSDSVVKEECKFAVYNEGSSQRASEWRNLLNVLPNEPILIEDDENSSEELSSSKEVYLNRTNSVKTVVLPPSKGKSSKNETILRIIKEEENLNSGNVSDTVVKEEYKFVPYYEGSCQQNSGSKGLHPEELIIIKDDEETVSARESGEETDSPPEAGLLETLLQSSLVRDDISHRFRDTLKVNSEEPILIKDDDDDEDISLKQLLKNHNPTPQGLLKCHINVVLPLQNKGVIQEKESYKGIYEDTLPGNLAGVNASIIKEEYGPYVKRECYPCVKEETYQCSVQKKGEILEWGTSNNIIDDKMIQNPASDIHNEELIIVKEEYGPYVKREYQQCIKEERDPLSDDSQELSIKRRLCSQGKRTQSVIMHSSQALLTNHRLASTNKVDAVNQSEDPIVIDDDSLPLKETSEKQSVLEFKKSLNTGSLENLIREALKNKTSVRRKETPTLPKQPEFPKSSPVESIFKDCNELLRKYLRSSRIPSAHSPTHYSTRSKAVQPSQETGSSSKCSTISGSCVAEPVRRANEGVLQNHSRSYIPNSYSNPQNSTRSNAGKQPQGRGRRKEFLSHYFSRAWILKVMDKMKEEEKALGIQKISLRGFRMETRRREVNWSALGLCKQCDFRTSAKDYKSHLCHIHNHNTVWYYCEYCTLKTKSKSLLIRHIYRHTAVKRFPCPHCKYMGNGTDNLKKHIRLQHLGTKWGKKYRCKHCVFICSDRGELMAHIINMHKHQKGKFKCWNCDFICDTQVVFRAHRRISHPGHRPVKSFNCSNCQFETLYYEDLIVHKNRQHLLSKRLFDCDQCKFKGLDMDHLKVHLYRKHDPYLDVLHCASCSFTSRLKTELIQHISRHMDVFAHKCPFCKYKSKMKHHLSRHINIRHNPNAILYYCDHCNYSSKVKPKLGQHMEQKHIVVKKKRKLNSVR